MVCSNPEENSCLNACVLLRRESIEATLDPLLRLALLKDWQRVSLGELVDGQPQSIVVGFVTNEFHEFW
jgi:hypothetical protein